MALKAFELYGEIFLKDDKVKEGLKGVDKQGKSTNKTMGKLAKTIGGVVTLSAFKRLGESMLSTASDALEMESKFNTVFGKTAQQADEWAEQFKDAVGGSRYEIKTMMASSQDLLTGFGATAKEGFELSKKIQTLGTDLASFSNIQGGANEAVDRLRKGLLGEHENLKALGIIINETALKQELASKGDQRKLQDLSELEKIELRYSIAIKQSQNAIGDAEKTSGSYVNQVRALRGELKDLVTEAGKRLIPVFLQIVETIRKNEKSIENVINVIATAFKVLGTVLMFVVDNINILLPLLISIGSIIMASKLINIISGVGESFGKVTKFLSAANPKMIETIGIILMVVTALTILGVTIATIMGRSKEMEKSFSSIGKATQDIGKQMQSGTTNPSQLPRFAQGINRLPQDMVAMVHKDEAVVPAKLNPYNPNAQANGISGTTNNYYNITLNAESVQKFSDITNMIENIKQTQRQGATI